MCKNIKFGVIFVFFCVFRVSLGRQHVRQDYNPPWNVSKLAKQRLLQQIRFIYDSCGAKLRDANPMRFMYEETPHYEQGYVLGEILERYRMMAGNIQRCTITKSYTFFDQLKYVELVQKLYFETYHLVNMFHEIPIKYYANPEFAINATNKDRVHDQEQFEKLEQQLKLEKKRSMKQRKKRKQALEKWEKTKSKIYMPTINRRPKKNEYWRIEYGWELNYWW